MKNRGWQFAAVAALVIAGGFSQVMAASSPGAFVTPGDSNVSLATQYQAAEAFATTGVSKEEARTVLVDGSKGSFMPAAAAAMGSGTVTGAAVSNIMNNASGTRGLASLRIASGATAVAASNVGAATATAIGGSGGVIQNRMNTIMSERRATVESFGASSALASAYMNSNLANRLWVSPFYVYQDMSKKDGYAAYDYKAWGASLGYDRAFGQFTAGVAFTYSRGDYDEKDMHDDNTVDNYGVSAYINYYSACSGFWAGLNGGYNYGDNEMKQFESINNGWVNGDSHTNTYWLGGNVGYDFKISENWMLTPSTGLYWSESKSSAYTTSGVLSMNVGKIKNKALLLPVDLAATYTTRLDECSTLQFKVGGGYSYNFKNDGAEGDMRYNYAGALPIVIQGVKPGRHGWNATAGIKYTRNRFDVGLDYRYDGKKKFDGHRVSATFGVSF